MENENLALFKYCPESNIKYIFKDKTLRFTQPSQLNDPLELRPLLEFDKACKNNSYEINGIKMPSMNKWYQLILVEQVVNRYGILSLTSNCKSINMWNYYANGHKGFIIKFKNDFHMNNFIRSEREEFKLKKVDYVSKYTLDIGKISNNAGYFTENDYIDDAVFKKIEIWSYECEYRLIKPLTDFPNYQEPENLDFNDSNIYSCELDFKIIDSIIFGSLMSKEDKQKIYNEIKNYDISIFQALLIKGRISNDAVGLSPIEIVKITDFDNIKNYQPKNFVFDDFPFDEKVIKIDTIDKLPYYNETYKQQIEQLFNAKQRQYNKEMEQSNPLS